MVSDKATITNSTIIPPCFVGEGAIIENSVVGPYVSIGKNSSIIDSRVKNSIIQENTRVSQAVLENSMLGNFVNFEKKAFDLSVGDYNTVT